MYGRTCGRCGGLMGVVTYEHVPDFQPYAKSTHYGDRALWRCDSCALELEDRTGDYSRASFLVVGTILGGAFVEQSIACLCGGLSLTGTLPEAIGGLAVGLVLLALVAINAPRIVVNWRWLRRSPLNTLPPARAILHDADPSDSAARPATPRTSS